MGFGADGEAGAVEEIGGEAGRTADLGTGAGQGRKTAVGGIAVAEEEDRAVTEIEKNWKEHRVNVRPQASLTQGVGIL